jgi:hypothetical protein
MLRKLIQVGAIVTLMTGAAAAQDTVGIPLNARKTLTKEDIDKQRATDDAYRAAMKKIPDKPSSDDPWGNVRPAAPTTAKNKQQ